MLYFPYVEMLILVYYLYIYIYSDGHRSFFLDRPSRYRSPIISLIPILSELSDHGEDRSITHCSTLPDPIPILSSLPDLNPNCVHI